jgi:hypothetical protein
VQLKYIVVAVYDNVIDVVVDDLSNHPYVHDYKQVVLDGIDSVSEAETVR